MPRTWQGGLLVTSVSVVLSLACGGGDEGSPTTPSDGTNDPPPSPNYPPPALTPTVTYPIAFIDGSSGLSVRRANGEMKALISDPSFEVHAAEWSPDADWLAFIADTASVPPAVAELFVVDSTGTGVVQVSSAGDEVTGFTWSPDGARLAYATRGGALWTVGRDGTGASELTAAAAGASHPRWSPDDDWILHTGSDSTGTPGVLRIRSTNTELTLLVDAGPFFAWPARYSPDGGRIVFDDGLAIGIMNSDGSDRGLIASGTDVLARPEDPRWSPGGDYIAHTRGGLIEIIDARSGALLDTFRSTTAARFISGPAVWGPDGVHIAFPSGDSIAVGELGRGTQWAPTVEGSFVAWVPAG